jgi:hypothetical protein
MFALSNLVSHVSSSFLSCGISAIEPNLFSASIAVSE